MCRDDLLDADRIFDIADGADDGDFGTDPQKFLLDRVERELVELEQHQPPRLEARDLAAQLGADRAAGAGDHDGAVFDPALESAGVEHHRIAAQQVVEFDVADLRNGDLAADEIVIGGHGHDLETGFTADVDRASPAVWVAAGIAIIA